MLDLPYPSMLDPESPEGGPDRQGVLEPGRLWSLWDMYNFVLRDYDLAVGTVEIFALHYPFDKSDFVTRDQGKEIANRFKEIIPAFKSLEMDAAVEQSEGIIGSLRGLMPNPSRSELETRCHVLLQTIHNAARRVRFYYYPEDKADALEKIDDLWGPAFKAFPSAKREITAGVDLWALGHSTAAVFHMMRAAEIALRALARERRVKITKGKPLEWETWGKLLDAIRAKVDEIHKKKNGPRKDAAVHFYGDALGHMTSLKDKYRDQVSHVRRDYDEHEALSAINHVREMMVGLASRLDETSTKMIAWGLK